jgi:hypothetical protein
MKSSLLTIPVLVFMGSIAMGKADAQDQVSKAGFNVSADVYSNYIWRGTRYGQGPHIQPSLKFEAGGLTLGVWGSFDFSGYSEADPYISYSLPFGLSLGMTDYYYPGLSFFETSKEYGSHAFEINAGYTVKGLNLSANYILNEAGNAGSAGGDVYFQVGYTFNSFNIFAGAGDGWHTSDGEFNLCNIGIGAVRTVEITDKFSLPLTGQVILNPDTEQFYLVVGFSF